MLLLSLFECTYRWCKQMIYDSLISKLARNPIINFIYRTITYEPQFQRIAIEIKKKEYGLRYKEFLSLSEGIPARFEINWFDQFPCLEDNTRTTGYDRHYIYHPAWAVRKLSIIQPKHHIDISSSLSFCSIVSAFFPIHFFDLRPAQIKLNNLYSYSADLLHLPFKNDSVHSLSCMHTIEHIGLGRYGDALDPEGDIKAINEIKRVLSPGASLLFVVPVGKPRLLFNAHRIYSYRQICDFFSDYILVEFSLIPDSKGHGIIENATEIISDSCLYGCGCFWFKRPE